MGAEIGATTSLFAYDDAMARYLKSTGREDVADAGRRRAPTHLRADDEVLADPGRLLRPGHRDRPRRRCGPLINGPHTPDLARPGGRPRAPRPRPRAGPRTISSALVGSCTNSSYEDITRAASIARHARRRTASGPRPTLMITPGSEQVRATIERDGLLGRLRAASAPPSWPTPAAPASASGPGPTWPRATPTRSSPPTTATSPSATTASASTLAFVTSPETVVALALAGTVDFDPVNDTLTNDAGEQVTPGRARRRGAAAPGLHPRRERLRRAARRRRRHRGGRPARRPTGSSCSSPSPPGTARTTLDLPILVKAKGKCTTDHISAAGPWLKYRGHLENISGNLFLGAVNAFTGVAGEGKDQLDGRDQAATRRSPSTTTRPVRAGWPSATRTTARAPRREHAAMEPRFRNAKVVIARSFARIAETNLKKQGVLPLTFADPATYDQIGEDDRISILGLADLAAREHGRAAASPSPTAPPSTSKRVQTLSPEQIDWFRGRQRPQPHPPARRRRLIPGQSPRRARAGHRARSR